MWLTASPPVTRARYSAPSRLPQQTVFTRELLRRVRSIASSPLRIRRPFSFRMWGNTSLLAFRMFSREPKFSMWESPMLVMSPTSGRTMADRYLDLAGVVHAHLQHGDLVALVQPEQGGAGADVRVEVALGLEDLVVLPQDGGHHVLGGGLTHAACHRHHRDVKLLLVPHGQVPQGTLGVVHPDIELAGQVALPLPLGEAGRSAALQRGGDVGVAVKAARRSGGRTREPSWMVRLSVSTRLISRSRLSKSPRIRPFTAVRISRMVIGSICFSLCPVFFLHRNAYRPCFRASRDASTMRWHSAS